VVKSRRNNVFSKLPPHLRVAILLAIYFAGCSESRTLANVVSQSGTINGKVVADIPDQQKTIPGVTVTISGNVIGDRKLQTTSDEEGAYSFTGLTAGDYNLVVELQGFNKYEQKISVQIDATVEVNILLQPIAITGTVTVTDDQTASKTESSVPGVITTSTLRDAPLIDQRFQDALPLLPGIVRGPTERSTSKAHVPHRVASLCRA
jgi:hypothetical protein